MKSQEEPHVVSADRLNASVIITFNDGRCAVYSSALLYAALPQAEELYDSRAAEKKYSHKLARINFQADERYRSE